MLNFIWIFFFVASFATASFKWLVLGNATVFSEMLTAMFSLSKSAFEISLGLCGVLTLWLGIMNIGEKSGHAALCGIVADLGGIIGAILISYWFFG